jgi:hypothetical protein
MESKTERKARLRKAAGDAIMRAIETGGDPFDLMAEATGEGPNIYVPYIQQHPFFTEKRHLFKTAEDRERDRDQAAIAAEPGPIVGFAASSTTIGTPPTGLRMSAAGTGPTSAAASSIAPTGIICTPT